MRIESKDFRMRKGDRFNFEKWPTEVGLVYDKALSALRYQRGNHEEKAAQ